MVVTSPAVGRAPGAARSEVVDGFHDDDFTAYLAFTFLELGPQARGDLVPRPEPARIMLVRIAMPVAAVAASVAKQLRAIGAVKILVTNLAFPHDDS